MNATVAINGLKQWGKHHPIVFFCVFKYTILLNVITSCIGGLLWVVLWNAANDAKSGYDLYYSIQPLSTIPKWVPQLTSYIFIIVITMNIILFILFMIGMLINKPGEKIELKE